MSAAADRQVERRNILKYFGLVSVFTAPLFVYIYWMLGSHGSALSVLIGMFFLIMTYPIWRWSGSSTVAGNWILAVGYCIFLVNALSQGGNQAPSLVWSLVIPMIAVLMCGFRSGLVWLALVFIKLTVFYWLTCTGHPFRQEFSTPGTLQTAYYVTVAGLVFFTFFLAGMSEHFKRRYVAAIEKSEAELKTALDNVKTLKGLVPICAWCRKIRDDKGYWDLVEVYVQKHTDAEFSHGICPECAAGFKNPGGH